MRDSALIQHDNGVLHVPVHKIHTEVGAVGGTPWAPLNRTVNFGGRTREVHPLLQWGGME